MVFSVKLKWIIYLPLNAVLGWVIRTAIYAAWFVAAPWDWTKTGWVVLLYLGVGLAVSLGLSFIMWFWKHWNWTNILYRIITAAASTAALYIGFTYLVGANPTDTQVWIMTAFTAVAVVGGGASIADAISDAFSKHVTKNYIGAA